MFYQVYDEIEKISLEEIDPERFTAGYISSAELSELNEHFGFADYTVEASKVANPLFRTGVDVHDFYTFTELRIVNEHGEDDWITLFLMKNFMLVVDVHDEDNSTKNSFKKSLRRFSASKIKIEKVLCAFIEELISDGARIVETTRTEITDMEETIIARKEEKNFDLKLLEIKKKLLKYYNYYNQLLDMSETLRENENDIFEDDDLIYISNLSSKLKRLKDDMDSLSNSADHLQDTYSSMMDQKMNQTMKIFTVITSIFFPLTIIVGWYGMNFESMPEFKWGYGYLYVILLSIAVVAALVVICKKKKWF